MKKTNFYLSLTIVLFALSILSSCKKDDEETNNDFYGKWQSKAYMAYSLTGALIYEQMVFNFTNTTFEDKVYQGATANAMGLAAGIKGAVEYTAPSTLDVTINEISIQGAPYVAKSVDEASFNALFNATLGQKLNEEFTATYEFVNDTMIMSLPMKNPEGGADIIATLRLTKVDE